MAAAASEQGQTKIENVAQRPVEPSLPAARLQLRSASEYDGVNDTLAARSSNQALLLARSAQTGLDQLLAKVEQMKEVARKGALTQTSALERTFLRMDLGDLFREYNAVASSTIGDLVGGLTGSISAPVRIERAGDSTAARGFSSFSLGNLSRPIAANDQFRLKVAANPETVYVADRSLYSPLPPLPADIDADGMADDPAEEAQWLAASNTAGANVIDALQTAGNGFNTESGNFADVRSLTDSAGTQLETGFPLQSADTLFFASRGFVQFLTVRAFLPVTIPGNEPQPGTTSIALRPADAPIQLRSLADTRIRGLEIGEGGISSFAFLSQGGSNYLGGADAFNIPISLTGGTGQGARGYGDLTNGSFTTIVLPYRGSGYSAGDQLAVSLADLGNHGSGFSTTIGVGASGDITAITQLASLPLPPSTSRGTDYLGGGSGTRVPVRILQTQTDPLTGNINVVSSATGTATIQGGELTGISIVSGGSGYIATDSSGDDVPVTVEMDLSSAVSEVTLKVVEVGNGNLSPDTFIYDAAYRSIDAVAGRVFFANAGRDGASAPSRDQFSSVLSSLENLTPVLKNQSLRAKLEVDRLDSQIRSFGGLNPQQKDQGPVLGQLPSRDGLGMKLARMLARVNVVADTTISLLESVRSQKA